MKNNLIVNGIQHKKRERLGNTEMLYTSGARNRHAYRVRQCASPCMGVIYGTKLTKVSCSAFPWCYRTDSREGGTILGVRAVSVSHRREEEAVACERRANGHRVKFVRDKLFVVGSLYAEDDFECMYDQEEDYEHKRMDYGDSNPNPTPHSGDAINLR